MACRLRHAALVIVLSLVATSASAQFWDRVTNPRVTVQLTHPPGLGLKVVRVGFLPAEGSNCSSELMDSVIEDFVNNGIDVTDWQNIEKILEDQQFMWSGFVDPRTVARLGEILGPAALVSLKVPQCDSREDSRKESWEDHDGNQRLRHISRTRVFYRASVQTVDLTTGRIFAAKTLDADQSEEFEADQCCPEHPSADDLMERALRTAVRDIHKMFFPWSETRQLFFFDDKDCDLKTAHLFLLGGDRQGALRQSKENLEKCRALPGVKPKVMIHALYNVGMANFILGEHERALESFSEAAKLGGGRIIAESMVECRRAMQLAAAMQRLAERADVEAAVEPTAVSRPPAAGPDASGPGGAPPQASVVPQGIEERLTKLEGLFKKGLVTKDEYEHKKAQILEGL